MGVDAVAAAELVLAPERPTPGRSESFASAALVLATGGGSPGNAACLRVSS